MWARSAGALSGPCQVVSGVVAHAHIYHHSVAMIARFRQLCAKPTVKQHFVFCDACLESLLRHIDLPRCSRHVDCHFGRASFLISCTREVSVSYLLPGCSRRATGYDVSQVSRCGDCATLFRQSRRPIFVREVVRADLLAPMILPR